MQWYYADNGQQAGPVEESEFPGLLRAGKLTPETLVWREGMANWAPFRTAAPPEFLPPPAATPGATPLTGPEAVCAECGGLFPKDDMIAHGGLHICARCKPVFMQKLAEGVTLPTGERQFAGFWIRLAAKLLDTLILMVPLFAVFVAIGVMAASSQSVIWMNFIGLFAQLFFYAANVAYSTFFVGRFGATPGKMICGLRIVTATGEKVTYSRAAGRVFAELLSSLLCNIGYLIAAFDQEKRALHDHMCSTRVVRK
jgi:uncharacterized RDD family membrane protein YckC